MATELTSDGKGSLVSQPVRCKCKQAEDKLRRGKKLLRHDGLTARERQHRFVDLDDTHNLAAIIKVRSAVEVSRGLFTLQGAYGVGKTTLLICAVNEARERGKLAIYTTLADLLSYLRSTFDPDTDVDYDDHWDALTTCDVLALDELDDFNSTPWAMERFLSLIDERWRRMDETLTLCALNKRITSLPGKVQSRLNDGRAELIAVEGPDMRNENSWNQN